MQECWTHFLFPAAVSESAFLLDSASRGIAAREIRAERRGRGAGAEGPDALLDASGAVAVDGCANFAFARLVRVDL